MTDHLDETPAIDELDDQELLADIDTGAAPGDRKSVV